MSHLIFMINLNKKKMNRNNKKDMFSEHFIN